MKSGAGKTKGSSFARLVCKRLSLWLSDGARDDLLWRSAMSGGRATVQFNSGKVNLAQSGDVTAVGQGAYEFCERAFVEAKHYRDLGIDRGLVCGTGTLARFWAIARREAAKYGKEPVLIARQNLFPTLLIVDSRSILFQGAPLLQVPGWCATVYLFDDVTEVTRIRMIRRA